MENRGIHSGFITENICPNWNAHALAKGRFIAFQQYGKIEKQENLLHVDKVARFLEHM